jgi:hypothetical protein
MRLIASGSRLTSGSVARGGVAGRGDVTYLDLDGAVKSIAVDAASGGPECQRALWGRTKVILDRWLQCHGQAYSLAHGII